VSKSRSVNIASCLPVVFVINSDLEVFVKVVAEMVCVELCKGVLASERSELVSTSTTVEGIVRRQRHVIRPASRSLVHSTRPLDPRFEFLARALRFGNVKNRWSSANLAMSNSVILSGSKKLIAFFNLSISDLLCSIASLSMVSLRRELMVRLVSPMELAM